MKTLVTGGIRSGKSAFAESLFADRPTTYVATSPPRPEDPLWQERIDAHRRRRPEAWRTRETHELSAALDGGAQSLDVAAAAVLIDDVGGWLTAVLDALEAWERPLDQWRSLYQQRVQAFLDSVENTRHDLVIVTGEVGYGLVPPYASGRLFTDELGLLNQRLGALCDEVVLVVCGCPLMLKGMGAP